MIPASTVIVVSYRPGDWLRPCLESVIDQAEQVIVVDNASEGAMASTVARSLGAEVMRASANLGFAGGVARGLTRVTGELVGVLNDDAVAGPDWLRSAADLLADRQVAAVTPKVVLHGWYAEVVLDDEVWFAPGDARPMGRQLQSVTADGVECLDRLVGAGVHGLEHQVSGGRQQAWRWTTGAKPFYVPLPDGSLAATLRINGSEVPARATTAVLNHAGSHLLDHGIAAEHGLGAPDDGRLDRSFEPFGFSGTAPVFRMETLRAIGGFARPFFAYNEDTDWCLRARLAGMRIAYDPDGRVEHRLSTTSGGTRAAFVRYLSRRNSLLCLIRVAPPEVAQRYLWRHLVDGPGEGVRRSVLRHLPWALSTRASMRRAWVLTPREVWDRWAGTGGEWERGPVGEWT